MTPARGNRENDRPTVIGGAKRRTYLEENVAAADIVLSTAELAALDEVAPVGVAAGERYPQAGMASVHI